MLEKEEDFKECLTLLEERVALKGAKLMFLPRFHPELNPIECVYMFGFLSKRIMVNSLTNNPRDIAKYCRTYNIIGCSAGFCRRVLTADKVVTAEQCQKYFNSCQR